MQKIKYSGLGMATGLANVMAAGTVSNTQTATGTSSQANSFAIVDDVTIFTTAASNSGARLPSTSTAGDVFFIANQGSNTMLVYPPSGGKINNGTADASVNLTTKKCGLWVSIDGTNYVGGLLS